MTDTPTVVDSDNDTSAPGEDTSTPASDTSSNPGGETSTPGDDPDVAEVELDDDDYDSDPIFSGSEEPDDPGSTTSDSGDGQSSSSGDDGDGEVDPFGAMTGDPSSPVIKDRVTEASARLAVVGLEDGSEKDELQGEFEEVFEVAGLGHFASEFAMEYVFTEEKEEIDPAWGLLGSSLICAAFVVHMRPDGTELVGEMRDTVSNISNGGTNSTGGDNA